jgi:hypothetical protein
MASQSKLGILAFQANKPQKPFVYDGRKLLDLRDRLWIKGDLLDYFNVRDRLDITETQSIGAGIFFIKKTGTSIQILNQWQEVYKTHFSLVDDSSSYSDNLHGFLENRHDQSIFSILCKLNNVETISSYEYWYPSNHDINYPDWAALKDCPIWAMRNKDFGTIGNLKMWFLAKYGGLTRRLRL